MLRQFLNTALGFIGATSLTDAEFGSLPPGINPGWEQSTYEALSGVLLTRENVTEQQKRLINLFAARGTIVVPTETGTSKIFVGAGLED